MGICCRLVPKLVFVLFMLFLTLGAEAQPTASCDGPPKNLRGQRWWHFYERGLSYMKDECWQKAAADFKKAIAQQGRDKYRVKTSGSNYISYFPHRELGIAYFQLKEYDKAIQSLQTSLKHVGKRNRKAETYLTLAQRA